MSTNKLWNVFAGSQILSDPIKNGQRLDTCTQTPLASGDVTRRVSERRWGTNLNNGKVSMTPIGSNITLESAKSNRLQPCVLHSSPAQLTHCHLRLLCALTDFCKYRGRYCTTNHCLWYSTTVTWASNLPLSQSCCLSSISLHVVPLVLWFCETNHDMRITVTKNTCRSHIAWKHKGPYITAFVVILRKYI